MKAPYCVVCHSPMVGSVHFADYRFLGEGMAGDSRGEENFCSDHLAAAAELTHLKTKDAMSVLAEKFGSFPRPPTQDVLWPKARGRYLNLSGGESSPSSSSPSSNPLTATQIGDLPVA